MTALKIAIIGAGPAGYYTAEALTASPCGHTVDIIDRLPTPFGLIRAGVAPDHQSIKAVAKRYTATAERDNVHFVGNLALGRDITLGELRTLYDAVVLATGAGGDRKLNIEGANLPGVIGSATFVGWYNSHPDFTDLNPNLHCGHVAVIGNGNVAVDVVRILAKTQEELAATDLAEHARPGLAGSKITDIYMLGRRGPEDAKYTPKEIGELAKLERARVLVDPADLPDASLDGTLEGPAKKTVPLLREIAANPRTDAEITIHLKFYARPMAVLGEDSVSGLRLERTARQDDGSVMGTGETFTLDAGLVIPAIGYLASRIEDVPYDPSQGAFINTDGLIEPGLYCVGWARRGPTGTIGTNKPDGSEIAKRIMDEVQPSDKPGRAGLDGLIRDRGLKAVTFRDWTKIDAAEQAAAKQGAPRAKFSAIDDMVRVAKGD